jgi:hypothetical protein
MSKKILEQTPPQHLSQLKKGQRQGITHNTLITFSNPQVTSQYMSYPILQAKPSTHRMYAQDQLFHIYGLKVFIDNQMSQIKYIYYINNISKD